MRYLTRGSRPPSKLSFRPPDHRMKGLSRQRHGEQECGFPQIRRRVWLRGVARNAGGGSGKSEGRISCSDRGLSTKACEGRAPSAPFFSIYRWTHSHSWDKRQHDSSESPDSCAFSFWCGKFIKTGSALSVQNCTPAPSARQTAVKGWFRTENANPHL